MDQKPKVVFFLPKIVVGPALPPPPPPSSVIPFLFSFKCIAPSPSFGISCPCYWKCNFPMTRCVRSVVRLVGQSVIVTMTNIIRARLRNMKPKFFEFIKIEFNTLMFLGSCSRPWESICKKQVFLFIQGAYRISAKRERKREKGRVLYIYRGRKRESECERERKRKRERISTSS